MSVSRLRYTPSLFLILALGFSIPVLHAATTIEIATIKRSAPIDFDTDIYPILRANCINCHNKTTTKGELNLETPELMRRGGESGKGFVPGAGLKSLIVRSAAHLEDPHMPPKDNKVKAVDLTPEQLGLICRWIDEGAKTSPHTDRIVKWEPLPNAFKSIYATAISGDGMYAACSRGGQIAVYHVPTRQLVARLTDDGLVASGLYKNPGMAHRDLVPSLAFSPDRKRLASGSFREIKIWVRDEKIETQQLPADAARKADVKPNVLEQVAPGTGQQLTAAKDGTFTIWDATKKTKIKELKQGSEILALAVSFNGARAATACASNFVAIWDIANGALIAQIRGDKTANDAAAKATLYAAFLLSETEYRRGEQKTAEADLKKLEDRVKTVTTDLKTAENAIAAKEKARDDAAKVKGEVEKANPAPELTYAVPDATTLKATKEAEAKRNDAAKKCTDTESDLARAHEAVAHQQLELKLANEHVSKQTQALADAKTAVAGAEKAQKAGDDEAKKLTDAAAALQRVSRALAFSPDGLQLATAADDGFIHFWSALDGTALRTLAGCGGNSSLQRTMSWDAKGITLTAEDGSRVTHTLATAWKLERTLGGDSSPMRDRVNALKFAPDGKSIAAGSGEFSRTGEVTIWNVENGELIKSLPDLHKDSVLALGYSFDGKLLATGSADKSTKILDTKTWKVTKTFEGHTNYVLGVAWRAEGRTFATAGAEGAVKVWDLASGDRKKNIEGWDSEVTSIQYVGLSGNFLAACGDKRVRLMADTSAEVRSYVECKEYMQSAAASDDGNTVIGGGQDGVLRIWEGGTGKAIVQFSPP